MDRPCLVGRERERERERERQRESEREREREKGEGGGGFEVAWVVTHVLIPEKTSTAQA